MIEIIVHIQLPAHVDIFQKYVQNVLKEQLSDQVIDYIVKKGGHFYVCGDVTMAADVGKAFESILMENELMTDKAASGFVTNMKVKHWIDFSWTSDFCYLWCLIHLIAGEIFLPWGHFWCNITRRRDE